MSNLKGTKTEENLMHAFAGESMARNKYTYYAAKAKEEGYDGVNPFVINLVNNVLKAKGKEEIPTGIKEIKQK